MSSIKHYTLLALMLSLSMQQATLTPVSLAKPAETQALTRMLQDDEVTTLVDVAHLMEQKKLSIPKHLKTLFEHLYNNDHTVATEELKVSLDEAEHIVNTHTTGQAKGGLVRALNQIRATPSNPLLNSSIGISAVRRLNIAPRAIDNTRLDVNTITSENLASGCITPDKLVIVLSCLS